MTKTQTPSGAGSADEQRAALEEKAAKGDRDAQRALRFGRMEAAASQMVGDRDPTTGKPITKEES